MAGQCLNTATEWMNMIPELNLIEIGKSVIADRFPEFSRGYLTIEFKPVENSISEVYHTCPFEDNRFRGEIEIYLDKDLMIYGLRAIFGTTVVAE